MGKGKGKKKGRKMPLWKKVAGAAIGGLGVLIGVLVATRPFHRGLGILATGNVAGATEAIGFDIGVPGVGRGPADIDFPRIFGVGVAAAIGIGVFALFKYLRRRV
jgi:hypothetical protein